MNEEIKDKLEEIYIFPLDVEYVDFRQYKIYGQIDYQDFEIPYLYNVTITLDANVQNICEQIDKTIVSLFRKARL